MKVDSYSLQRVYGNFNQVNRVATKKQINENKSFENVNNKIDDNEKLETKSIITSSERNFFVNMFPESSERLKTYEVFTRNGKVSQSAVAKGTVFDSRI